METITLNITAQTLNTIGAALQELPHKVAAPALKEIDEQVQAFLKEKKDGEQQSSPPGEVGGADAVRKRTRR